VKPRTRPNRSAASAQLRMFQMAAT
jgi:hypothetical protein